MTLLRFSGHFVKVTAVRLCSIPTASHPPPPHPRNTNNPEIKDVPEVRSVAMPPGWSVCIRPPVIVWALTSSDERLRKTITSVTSAWRRTVTASTARYRYPSKRVETSVCAYRQPPKLSNFMNLENLQNLANFTTLKLSANCTENKTQFLLSTSATDGIFSNGLLWEMYLRYNSQITAQSPASASCPK